MRKIGCAGCWQRCFLDELQSNVVLFHIDCRYAYIDFLFELISMIGRTQPHIDHIETEFFAAVPGIDKSLNTVFMKTNEKAAAGDMNDTAAPYAFGLRFD